MNCYTIQLAKHRLLTHSNIELIDITVKSGLALFAPTWEMVRGVKSGTLSEEDYIEQYTEMMRLSWSNAPEQWLALFEKPAIALGCYCPAESFCHRHLLVYFLSQIAAHRELAFINHGELR